MLGLSNRERMIRVMDEARMFVESRAEYYNLLRDEEVQELLSCLQAIRGDLQQKNDEAYAKLAKDNVM